jgi:acetate kinase
VRLDRGANAAGDAVIGASNSGVEVRVIPADEEGVIARHSYDLLQAVAGGLRDSAGSHGQVENR